MDKAQARQDREKAAGNDDGIYLMAESSIDNILQSSGYKQSVHGSPIWNATRTPK